ncbi:MAG: ferric reductase-like transmembrane domain-containing protein [Acidimicrobiales bacterium]
MNPQIWWYVARASGIVGWLLLTATVIWGILTPAKLSDRQRPAWFLDLHRWLAGLTIGFVAIHLAALIADSYVEFGIVDLLVPFASDWKPFPVAIGVLATWLLITIQATSLATKRLPRTVWRKIHLTSYLTFFLTSLHGTLAGTDATNTVYQATSIAALAAVIFTTLFRIMTRRRRPLPRTSPKRAPTPEAVSADI